MRTMIIEGGRAAPAAPAGRAAERAVAVVVVFVLPGPVDRSGQKRTPDFFVAVGADPSAQTQAWMGIPGGIMTVTSHCSRTAVEALMINLRAMGWEPRPGQGGKIPVQQAMSRPYAPRDVAGQQFLQYLLDLQAGMMRPEDLPAWMQIKGLSQTVYRPCGAVVGPRGPALGSPCPGGPCPLNDNKACVWQTHAGRGQPDGVRPAPAAVQDPRWRQQAVMASQLSAAPSNGSPDGSGYAPPVPQAGPPWPAGGSGYAPPVPGRAGFAPPRPPGPPYGAVPQNAPGMVHPPGGEFVLDMTPGPPQGEFQTAPLVPPAEEPPAVPAPAPKKAPTPKKKVTRRRAQRKPKG